MTQFGGYLEWRDSDLRLVDSGGEETLFSKLPKDTAFKSEFNLIGDLREINQVGGELEVVSTNNSKVKYSQRGNRFFPVEGRDGDGHILFSADYDGSGALKWFRDRDGSETKFTVEGKRIHQVKPAFGAAYLYSYDANGYLKKIEQGATAIDLEYTEATGNIKKLTTTEPSGNTTFIQYSYGSHNVLTGITGDDGDTVQITYTAGPSGAGVTTTQRNAANVDISFTKVSYRTFLGSSPRSSFRYEVPFMVESGEGSPNQSGIVTYLATLNRVGNPLSVIDAAGQQTKYEYSILSASGAAGVESPFPTKIIAADGTSTLYARNPNAGYRVEGIQFNPNGSSGRQIHTLLKWSGLERNAKPLRTDKYVGSALVSTAQFTKDPGQVSATTVNTTLFKYGGKINGRATEVVDSSGVTQLAYRADGTVSTVTSNGVETAFSKSFDPATGHSTRSLRRGPNSISQTADYYGDQITNIFTSPGYKSTTKSLSSDGVYGDDLPKTGTRTTTETRSNLNSTGIVTSSGSFEFRSTGPDAYEITKSVR
jgi:hypothetical protein